MGQYLPKVKRVFKLIDMRKAALQRELDKRRKAKSKEPDSRSEADRR